MILRLLTGLLATALLVACVQVVRNSGQEDLRPPADGALRLATYNVHYIILSEAEGAWSVGDWERRKDPMAQAVTALQADVIAFQEMESFQGGSDGSVNLTRDWLLAEVPGFSAGAIGDWRAFPSTQPIFYRTDRFELLDQGWFFFSDTPDVIYSRTFDGSYPAFASWVLLRDRDGAEFRVVNVHFEYSSRSNRLKSAGLVAERVRPWIEAGEVVFLAGDINARLGARTLAILEDVGFAFAPVEGSTYHFNRGLNLFGAIDHLAVAGPARLQGGPVVLRQKFGGEWPTDHYPVVGDFDLQ